MNNYEPIFFDNTRVEIRVIIPHKMPKVDALFQRMYKELKVDDIIEEGLQRSLDGLVFKEHLEICHQFAKKIKAVKAFGMQIRKFMTFTVRRPNFEPVNASIDHFKYDFHQESDILVMKIMMSIDDLPF